MKYVETIRDIISRLEELSSEWDFVNPKADNKIPIVLVRAVDNRDPILNLELETNIIEPPKPTGSEYVSSYYLGGWRGKYSHLCVYEDTKSYTYSDIWLDKYMQSLNLFLKGEIDRDVLHLERFLKDIKDNKNAKLNGYKGGIYEVDEDVSNLWIDQYGVCSFPSIRVTYIDLLETDLGYVCLVVCCNENITFDDRDDDQFRVLAEEIINSAKDTFNECSKVVWDRMEANLLEVNNG